VRCHAHQRRESDGAPFITHPVEVARMLRDAGCPEVVIVAGLLHDIVEKCDVTVSELAARFGADVAKLVQAVSDDASIPAFRDRKQMLREQVRRAGADAALLFAADKISKVRELPDLLDRAAGDRERLDLPAADNHSRHDLQHDHRIRLEHYRESLRMLQRIAPEHTLVKRLANELDACIIAIAPPTPPTLAHRPPPYPTKPDAH
jgi:(p)ppGpp synthase/HD superfamily hydrolase